MSFSGELQRWTADQIAAALGCPAATAYDWLSERRTPPVWQQRWWLEILNRKAPRRKAANGGKAATAERASKRPKVTKAKGKTDAGAKPRRRRPLPS